MKRFFISILTILCIGLADAQVYKNQNEPDKMWGKYCFRELNGKWYDALTSEAAMTSMPTSNEMILAYYYRIPAGHVRADIIWQNVYARFAKVNVKVIYPQTGQVLGEGSFGNTEIASKERIHDLFGDINFPADDFYRIELSSENWNAIKSINYFNYYRESNDPVLIPRNYGGTSAYLSDFTSTHPDAPEGKAYDWAYVECMVPFNGQYPGTYYMTLGTPTGYMGLQTNFAVGDNDFQRNVLFSVWDAQNMDEDPNLAEYLQSKVIDGNLDAVHTHAGGEGSSASIMFQTDPKWWRPDHWVQFLLNTRPMTTPVTVKTADNRDSTFNYGYTIMSAWYKMDTMPEWRYMATMRAAGICENLGGWYNFIEPFTSAAGQKIHTVYHRHAAMRSAASGKWYNRNQLKLGHEGITDRRYHYDYGRGATQAYDNCFFLEMGGYIHKHDSATVIPLAKDMTFVDTINTDALNKRIDQAIARDDYYNFASKVNACAEIIPQSTWSIVSEETSASSGARRALDEDGNSMWTAYDSPAYLTLKADEEQTITSFEIYWTTQYSARCHFVNIETSDDGENWQTEFENLEIRCLDRIEVSLPQPIKAKYFRYKFHYKYTPSNTLSINEITFRGVHDLEKLQALAKSNLDNANTINTYNTTDMDKVDEALAQSTTTGTQPLADALYNLASHGKFNRNYLVTNRLCLSADHAYYLKNANGYGVLSAKHDGSGITATGATSSDALAQYKNNEQMNDPYNNWLVLHDDRFEGYYLYNIGAQKFINFKADGMLSTQPQTLNFRQSGKAFYITPWDETKTLGLNPSLETAASIEDKPNNRSLFAVYDNFVMEKNVSTADSLFAITEVGDKLNLYKSGIAQMLEAPIGVVGGFTNEEAREALQAAYDNADNDPLAFIQAVENADVVEFDPANCVYRIKSANESQTSASFMTSDAGMRLFAKAENNNADQIWRFSTKNDGYKMSSQGVTLKPINNEVGITVTTTNSPALSGTYALSESSWGKYFISPAEWSKAVVGSGASPIKTEDNTNPTATWYIEPATTTNITMNSIGVNSAYYDFTFVVPEGLNAYAVHSINADGVISLKALGDTIAANTPVILSGAPYQKYSLMVTGDTEPSKVDNLLRGVYFRTTSLQKGTFVTLASSGGKAIMKKPAIAVVNANQVYIPLDETMPDVSTYTIDFDNIINAIADNEVQPQDTDSKTYDINGIPATSLVKGHIYIRNHKKIINH